jgi:hypothetical protein
MDHADLSRFLAAWPHEPGRINARRVPGEDGREKIQVRLDLGVIQMEIDGRPDGRRIESTDSLLDFHRQRRERYAAACGTEAGFVLSEDDCRALREEAVQYYHRYVALFALGDFARVVRDTQRNLDVIDVCRDHAATAADRIVMEQFRPHLIMMRTRAEAELALAEQDTKQALAAINRGLGEIEGHFAELAQPEAYEHSNEVQLLRGMRDTLVPRLPASQRVELEERLRAAIDAENYELAAILRDELRLLK